MILGEMLLEEVDSVEEVGFVGVEQFWHLVLFG